MSANGTNPATRSELMISVWYPLSVIFHRFRIFADKLVHTMAEIIAIAGKMGKTYSISLDVEREKKIRGIPIHNHNTRL